MTAYTLFSQEATGSSLQADTDYYTMGCQFSTSVTADLTAVWFYSPSGAGGLPGTIALFAVSGQSLVHSESATWSGAAGSGWVRAAFTSPPALTASVSYKAAVLLNTGDFSWYSVTSNFWSSGAGSGGITNGPLSAPNNGGGDGGQDTFNNGASLTYPDTSFDAGNYWVDPEITPTGTLHTATAALTVTAGFATTKKAGTVVAATVHPVFATTKKAGTVVAATVTPVFRALAQATGPGHGGGGDRHHHRRPW